MTKKKGIFYRLCMGLVFACLSSSCAPKIMALCYPQSLPFGSGLGTSSSPYTVCSLAQLKNVSQYLGSNFLLTQSLDLSSSNFSPIGSYLNNQPFTGTFDGGGNTLSNWTYNNTTTSDYVAFFPYVTGTIKNLNLSNFNLVANLYVGVLVGTIQSGSVQNCHVLASSAYIIGSGGWVGGVIGSASPSSPIVLSNSSSSGLFYDISGPNRIGGLVGIGNLAITHSYSTANVTCNNSADRCAGLVGETFAGSISTSYYAGGIVKSDNGAGGLVGNVDTTTSVTDCYVTGSIQGGNNFFPTAGIFSHATSGVSVLTRVFSTASISGTPGATGGLAAGPGVTVNSVSSYWDTQTSGQSGTGDSGSSAESTSAMQNPATYSGWDFVNTWYPPVPGVSYPALR